MNENFIRPLVDKFLIVPVYTRNPTPYDYSMLLKNRNISSSHSTQLKYYSIYYFNLCIVAARDILKKGDIALDLSNTQDSGIHKVSSEFIAKQFNYNFTIKQNSLYYNRFPGCMPIVKIIASTDKSLNLNNVPEGLIEAWLEDPTIKIEDVFLIDGELQVVLNENYIPHQ